MKLRFNIGDVVKMIPITEKIKSKYKNSERGRGGYGYESYKDSDKFEKYLTINEECESGSGEYYYTFKELPRGIYSYALDLVNTNIDLNEIKDLLLEFDNI